MLLGIHGKKGSGKDTFGSLLKDSLNKEHGERVQLIAFADMMKEVCAKVSGVPLQRFYDQDEKERIQPGWHKTPRQTMTDMHDALVPMFGEMIFVNAVRKVWESRWKDAPGLLITDVRYEREASWIRSEGGLIIHILRPDLEERGVLHSSEQGILMDSEKDYCVVNDGTLADLHSKARLASNWVITNQNI